MEQQPRRGRSGPDRRRMACLLTVSILCAPGVTAAQDLAIGPLVRAGDAFSLEVTRTRENTSRPDQDGTSRTIVEVRVLSAGADGFVLDWVPGETRFDNAQRAQDPMFAIAAEAVRDMHFQLTLNADGEIMGVANVSELMPKLEALRDRVAAELSARLPDAQQKPFQDAVTRLLSPDALISSATQEAQIYFGLNGVELSVDEAVEIDVESPNPVTGGTLPAVFRIRVESATAESAVLATSTVYDAAGLVRMTQALAQQAGASIPADELAAMPPIQMGDEGRYTFDRALGLMREVTIGRRITAGDNRRVDGWQIRLLSGPSR